MNRPYIAWNNLLRDGVLTATSQAAGFPIANAVNWLTYDGWRPTGTGTQNIAVALATEEAADYVAIAEHTLGSVGASVRVQYHNGSAWVNASAEFQAPIDDRPFIVEFDEVEAFQFRVRILNALEVPQVNVLSLGKLLRFERGIYIGHSPEMVSPRNEFLNNNSEGGQYIGARLIRRGINAEVAVDNLSEDFVYGEWLEFQEFHARHALPFFWAWNYTEKPEQVALVWPTGNPSASNSRHTRLMQVSIPVTGKMTFEPLRIINLITDDQQFNLITDNDAFNLIAD